MIKKNHFFKLNYHTLTVLFSITLFVGNTQMSYEAYKEKYIPNYIKLNPKNDGVKMADGYTASKLAGAMEVFVKDKEKTNVATILSSCDRKHIGKTLGLMSPAYAKQALLWLKTEWQLELMWFVDKETYHKLAPELPALILFTGSPLGPFGKKVKNFSFAYAGAGFATAWSNLKGINNWIPQNNSGSPNLAELHWFKGAHAVAGLKLKKDNFLDIDIEFKGVKGSNGGDADENLTRDIRFRNTTFSLAYMNWSKGEVFSYSSGIGLHYTLGNLSWTNPNAGGNWTKLDNFNNFGVNLRANLFINPSDQLPVMFGVGTYWNINFRKHDFSVLNEEFNTNAGDLESFASHAGFKFSVFYKLGKPEESKEYPTFDQEVIASTEKTINTKYTEINPMVSPDGKKIYFTREDHPLNTYGAMNTQDIWVADISNGFESAQAKHMDKPFNRSYKNSVYGLSPDGSTMMIKGVYKDGKYEGAGMSIVYKTKDGWSVPKKVEVKNFAKYSKGKYEGGFLSGDNKTIIMYMTPKNNASETDLYVSFKKEDGTFTEPQLLGNLNTSKSEATPFLASDNKTLYFASDRSGGEGNFDIWMSKREDDSWTKWSEPVNLGDEINTSGFDAYYSVDASGKWGYMVTTKNSKGLEDIKRFELKEEVQPDPVVLIRGKVFDAKTKEPLTSTIEYEGLTDGKKYGFTRTNPETGQYTIVLPYGVNYSFNAQAEGFIPVSDNIDLTQIGEYKEITRDLYLVPIEVGSTVRLNNIFFETSSAGLKKESFVELNRVIRILSQNSEMEIEVSGHTDNVGNKSYNEELSQKRAQSVVNYLKENGVNESRLVAKGYGMDKPVADNDTEEGRAENRRVEFTILKK